MGVRSVRGGRGRVLSLALVLTFAATAALAANSGSEPRTLAGSGPRPLLGGLASVDTTRNCYLPGQTVGIVLTNVGTGNLIYQYHPNFYVENDTVGIVRDPLGGFPPGLVVLAPGENLTWTWDGMWDRVDGLHKGQLVPHAAYDAVVEVLAGTEPPELVEVARHTFAIGDCLAQISAGAPIAANEGQTFTFDPTITITGDANVTSVTWDLNPAVDTNGDGNATDDIDLVGPNPSYAFGDNGVFPVVMNVRGFGTIQAKTRLDQDVVFSIDGSAFMQTADPPDLRLVAAESYVDRLVPHDRAATVVFRDTPTLIGQHHLSEDYAQVKADIGTIADFGGSALGNGLRRGLDELQANGNASHAWIEVFISAGQSTDARDHFDIPRAITLAKQLGARVYTVGVGAMDPDAESLMRDIANKTGGRYLPAPTTANLLTILDDLQQNESKGQYFVVSSTTTVTVNNVAPSGDLAAEVNTPPPANLILRVAGEKWHDVRLALLRDGAEAGNVSVVRTPGSPDDQTTTLQAILYAGNANVARLVYTPLDDPVNGQVNGANPAWVNVTTPDGAVFLFNHTFNVAHPDTWVWDIDLSAATSPETARATVAVHVTDPGTDDETITVDWGDGGVDSATVYNDGVGPDPYPSPWGSSVDFVRTFGHSYGAAGTYAVVVTLLDDDGGTTVLPFPIDVR